MNLDTISDLADEIHASIEFDGVLRVKRVASTPSIVILWVSNGMTIVVNAGKAGEEAHDGVEAPNQIS